VLETRVFENQRACALINVLSTHLYGGLSSASSRSSISHHFSILLPSALLVANG
jgi:hypothetical protein